MNKFGTKKNVFVKCRDSFVLALIIFFLPSFEGASLFVDGLILESILKSAADDRSTEIFTKIVG